MTKLSESNELFFFALFLEKENGQKIEIEGMAKEKTDRDGTETIKNHQWKKQKFANNSCWENALKVQNGALIHMMLNHQKLWNCVNSTY